MAKERQVVRREPVGRFRCGCWLDPRLAHDVAAPATMVGQGSLVGSDEL
jgi:hypothetical protein